jgi:hypothetical protein
VHIKRSRKNQHNAQTCTTALFHMLVPTCFGSSMPSSGSFWIRLNYVKIQIDIVVYLKYITDKHQCVKHLTWKNNLNGVITPGRTKVNSDKNNRMYNFYHILTRTTCSYYVFLTHCTSCCSWNF